MTEAGHAHAGSDCRKWHVSIKSNRTGGQGTVTQMQIAETGLNVYDLYLRGPLLQVQHDGSNPMFPTMASSKS